MCGTVRPTYAARTPCRCGLIPGNGDTRACMLASKGCPRSCDGCECRQRSMPRASCLLRAPHSMARPPLQPRVSAHKRGRRNPNTPPAATRRQLLQRVASAALLLVQRRRPAVHLIRLADVRGHLHTKLTPYRPIRQHAIAQACRAPLQMPCIRPSRACRRRGQPPVRFDPVTCKPRAARAL